MDGADQFAPNSPGSSSSSSSSSSYSSSPRSRGSIEEVGENRETVGGGRFSDDDDDEIGEFLSGGEEFLEPAEELEREEDDSDLPFVDSSGFPAPIVERASAIGGDGDGDGLKSFGVSGVVEGVGDGEAPKPAIGENGGLGGFVNGNGVGDGLERIDGVLVGGEEEKVLEIPKSGHVEAPVTEVEEGASIGSGGDKVDNVMVEPASEFVNGNGVGDGLEKIDGLLVGGEEENVLEIPKSGHVEAPVTEVEEGASIGSGGDKVDNVIVEPASEFVNGNVVGDGLEKIDGVSLGGEEEKVLEIPKLGPVEASVTEVEEGASVDKVDTVTVEPVNEQSGELDVVEVAGNGGSAVESRGSATEESDVSEKVKDEGKIDVLVGEEPAAVLEVSENGGVVKKDAALDGSEAREVEQVTEKLGEPNGTELAGEGDSVVEAVDVNLLASGAAVVGDVEETKLSEMKEKDILVVPPVSVDNVYDRISPDAEEPEKIAETTEVELNGSSGPETYASAVRKGTDQITSVVEEDLESVLEVKEKSEGVEEGTVLGNGIDKVEPVIGSGTVEPVSVRLEEPDVTGVAGKEDSVVEAINVNLVSGAAVIGDVEETKFPEIKEKDITDVVPVSVDNVFDRISPDAEEPEKIAEHEESIPETTEVEVNESNGDVTAVGKGNDHDMSDVVDVTTKDFPDFQKTESSDDENQTVDLTTKEEPMIGVAPSADSEAKLTELGGGRDEAKVQSCYTEPMNSDATKNAEPTEDHIIPSAVGEQLEDKANSSESSETTPFSNSRPEVQAEEDEMDNADEDGEITEEEDENETMIFGSSEAAKQFLEGLERQSGVDSHSGPESSQDASERIGGQIVTDSDEEADSDEEGDGKELFDSAALTALLKAATGADSEGGNITITSKDGSKLFSVEHPAGLGMGTSLRPVKPPTSSSWSNRPNLFSPPALSTVGETEIILSDEEKQKLEKLQQIRVKFLRLVQRLGHSPDDQIAAQVLYRLGLVAGRRTNQQYSVDAAKITASQLEEENKDTDDLNFSLNILVLGKTGVGKSSTINSIFGEEKSRIDAFKYATNAVKEINGTVGGVKIRVFDTPGLRSSVFEQGYNQKVLSSVKKLTKKCPPDIVLYVDRMDTQTRDLNDLPMLKTITSILGSSIWRSAIVTLTHAASAPPEGPTGNPLSYEVFVAQRSHIVQQSIGQAVGDLRMMSPSSMNPVSLVENHPSCRKNREGLKVLPNGQSWKPQLLFLCYSMKILSEASALSKPQDPLDHRKLFGFRARAPPLPYLLSWLLQTRTHPKLLTDQGRNDVDSDVIDDDVDIDEEDEEEEEYDQLPPFRPLSKEQLKKLTREQRNAYFDEYEYRVKLLQKKQWKEMKKGNVSTDDMGNAEGEGEGEGEGEAASDGMVSVPLPDMVLPHSFDGDSPAYRYRFLDPQSHLLTRPVLDTHGWDHDCGYDGVNIENRALAIKNQYPASVAVQITKDKKDFNIHLDSSISAKHGEKGSSMVGFDIQNVGKQLAYIVRAESKFKNLKRNKTTAGASVTFLGENIATGVKVEDQIALGKRLVLVGSTGTVRSRSDAAYGANLEVQLREADYPIGQDQSSLGLSLVKWRGDLAIGANLQSQVTIGRGSKVTVRAGLNNKRSGQISISLNSTEQLQLALVAIIPLARAIYKTLSPGTRGDNNYSMY